MGWLAWSLCCLVVLASMRSRHVDDGLDDVRFSSPTVAVFIALAIWFGWLIK